MPSEYPNHLIPTKENILISDNDLDTSDYMGVWVDITKPFKDNDGKLNAEAIDVARIPKFSTNKIPSSIISDLNICFIGDNVNYFNYTEWTVGEDGDKPNSEDFTTRNHYFLKISDIHQYTDNYFNPPDKKDVTYKFTVSIIHKPLIANYWHFEFDIKDANNNTIPKVKSTWHKLLCSTIRDHIQEKALFDL